MQDSTDDDVVEAIYDALDSGDPASAAALAQQSLESAGEDDPVLRLLWGLALLELDRPAEAVEQVARAVELDPEDPESRANLAIALFRAARFDEAEEQARRALDGDPALPDAHAVWALVLERQGRFDEADRHERLAAERDPERFPVPVRIPRSEFEAEIRLAGERLPERFRALLEQVAVTVERIPSEEILREEDPPLDPELLGLFVGVSLADGRAGGATGALPARILLFQRNLERHAHDLEDLRSEIAITLYHELGHYLGLDEQELIAIDLG